ncbi:MAG: hypothetical protein HWN68_09730 [Desulfobacterales bacterium]|nr:hypothetical protein [Desulfobacterales bacterium]
MTQIIGPPYPPFPYMLYEDFSRLAEPGKSITSYSVDLPLISQQGFG